MHRRLAVTGVSALFLAALAVGRRGEAADEADAAFARDVEPFVRKWCFECHSGEKLEGEIDLAALASRPSDGHADEAWRTVRRQLRRRAMPPKEAPQPPADEVARVLAWIDARAGRPAESADPGRTTIRRLSRLQYRYTIRDLVGVDFDAEARLPADDTGYGFDDIGDVMSLPPSLLEKYLAAAEEIAARAIIPDDPGSRAPRRFEAETIASAGKTYVRDGWRGFWTNGDVHTDVRLPRDGEYVVRVRAYGQQAGPDPVRMTVKVDGRALQTHDVSAVRAEPAAYETKVRLFGGRHALAAAFVNDYAAPTNPDRTRSDRNLVLDWVEVEGPMDARPVTPFERSLVGDDSRPRDRALAARIVKRFADRAFRRPATDEETVRLVEIVELAQKQGASYERGVQLAVTAVLVSPHFLFRVETDAAPEDPRAAHDLTDHELASRLSYFLWSSLPDDELLALAAKGALHDPAVLEAQTRRMLRDARSTALVTNFAVQWLELRRLDTAAPDAARFPQFDEAMRASMRRETEMFVEAVIREGRPLRDFLAADFTFVDERLARHYGVLGVKGDGFRRVSVPASRRAGLLTQASILTLTSNPTRTSPVKRGKFILDEILADPTPPPPPGVDSLDDSETAAKAKTLRERLARHRSDTKCASCHTRLDALGFALENFDAIGAWRDLDGTQPVDATGTFADGREFTGPAELRDVLVSDDAFARCLAERLAVYALGRGLSRSDRAAVDRLIDSLPGLDATFEGLVLGIVKTDGFRRRRGEAK